MLNFPYETMEFNQRQTFMFCYLICCSLRHLLNIVVVVVFVSRAGMFASAWTNRREYLPRAPLYSVMYAIGALCGRAALGASDFFRVRKSVEMLANAQHLKECSCWQGMDHGRWNVW